VPGIAAATILGNGRVAFILDVEKLSEMAVNSPVGNVMSSNVNSSIANPTNVTSPKAAQPALT
jgi:chemotaxis protein histidine kinase CheA